MNVLVCGAGHQGITMAGHLAFCGHQINLWNRSKDHIKTLMENKTISLNGIVSGTSKPEKISADMKDVITDFVMVTTPSSAHRDIAETIAPYVHKDMVIVLNPGRTFGAIEFAQTLTECGVKELPHIAETQTIIYTCRRMDETSVKIYAIKNDVKIASVRGDDMDYIISKIPECIRGNFTPVKSVALTSFSNVGMILHCAPVLMNIGWIETEKADFKYYYDGISQSVAGILEKMDAERIAVAKKFGCKIESVKDWLNRTYSAGGESIYECIRNNNTYSEIDAPRSIECRYIYEDVPNGLVPIEYLGRELGVATPTITMIIDLACAVTDYDFRENGRRFDEETLKRYF